MPVRMDRLPPARLNATKLCHTLDLRYPLNTVKPAKYASAAGAFTIYLFSRNVPIWKETTPMLLKMFYEMWAQMQAHRA